MTVREVRLSPYGGQTGERSTHADARTVYQVKGVFVVDGRNSDRLSIDDDGAECNEGDADGGAFVSWREVNSRSRAKSKQTSISM